VDGADNGITSTVRITDDVFSTGENRKLVNNKTYHFIAVAYAYNNYLKYVPDVSPGTDPDGNYLGQKRPYLEGRKLKKAAGIPHDPEPEKNGTVMQSTFGFGPKITRIEGQGNGGNLMTLTQESEDAIVSSSNGFVEQITYENGQGPITIHVVDPLNVKASTFEFKLINSRFKSPDPKVNVNAFPSAASNATNGLTGNGSNNAALNVDNTSWELKDLSTNKVYHPNEPSWVTGTPTTSTIYKDTLYQTIKVGNEFYFQDLGFSITVKQVADPGESLNSLTNNVFALDETYAGLTSGTYLGGSVTYKNGTSDWLGSIPDIDGSTPFNWILSGNSKGAGADFYGADAYYNTANSKPAAFYDPQKQFANVIGATWAPYPLTASYYTVNAGSIPASPARIFGGPAFNGAVWKADDFMKSKFVLNSTPDNNAPGQGNTDLRKLSSVLVVLTRDKNKWTRCPVLEMQERSYLSEGNVPFFSPRGHYSVDKDGNFNPADTGSVQFTDPSKCNYISKKGMGWFPGYAINIETGERLNMAFGEDSYQKENNGTDMRWNPNNAYNTPYPYAMGGKHFVYVFAGNTIQSKFTQTPIAYNWEDDLDQNEYGVGKYDAAKRMMNILNKFFDPSNFNGSVSGNFMSAFSAVERDIMWTSIPMPKNGYTFTDPANMPSDVKWQINVSKPYRYGFSGVANYGPQNYNYMNKFTTVDSAYKLTTHIKTSPANNNFPLYNFNTSELATLFDQNDIAKSALDKIKIVPNPYYGSSSYETNRIDNRIRITNLPQKCTIKIFSLNGTLIRTIKRDASGQEDQILAGDTKQSKYPSYVDWDLKNQNNITIASGLYIFHVDAGDLGEKIVKWFGVIRPLDVQNY
jgi:hypothetical protein